MVFLVVVQFGPQNLSLKQTYNLPTPGGSRDFITTANMTEAGKKTSGYDVTLLEFAILVDQSSLRTDRAKLGYPVSTMTTFKWYARGKKIRALVWTQFNLYGGKCE